MGCIHALMQRHAVHDIKKSIVHAAHVQKAVVLARVSRRGRDRILQPAAADSNRRAADQIPLPASLEKRSSQAGFLPRRPQPAPPGRRRGATSIFTGSALTMVTAGTTASNGGASAGWSTARRHVLDLEPSVRGRNRRDRVAALIDQHHVDVVDRRTGRAKRYRESFRSEAGLRPRTPAGQSPHPGPAVSSL